ncbi:MAG: hypothetical protein WCR45_04995 [Bacteroidaceae bacterium]
MILVSMPAINIDLFACKNAEDKKDIPMPGKSSEYITDYDDGENIYINVKIAIDKKGWEYKSPEYFKSKFVFL